MRPRRGNLRLAITAFEQASGVRFRPWQAGRIGAAVNAVPRG
jgi:hypothetical protein